MQGNRLAPKCRSDSVPVARSGILTRMGMRPLVALVAIMLVVSGCGAGGSPAPGASCQPGLVQAGETYRPATDAPPDLSAGEAVPNANLLGCQDAGQATGGGGPVDAWRASGKGDDYLVTLTACAQAEGTSAAADCDPDASRYNLWKRETAAS